MKVYDDWRSYIHTALGVFASIFSPVPITLCFIAYQYIEWRIKHDNVLGDIIEYTVGLIIGSAIKALAHINT